MLSQSIWRWVGEGAFDMSDTIFLENWLNSAEMNCGPLSNTNWRGKPTRQRYGIKPWVYLCSSVSVHVEYLWPLWCVSRRMKYIFPLKGPAKSTCILCHVFVGHAHVWNSATAGKCLWDTAGILGPSVRCPCQCRAITNSSMLKTSSLTFQSDYCEVCEEQDLTA